MDVRVGRVFGDEDQAHEVSPIDWHVDHDPARPPGEGGGVDRGPFRAGFSISFVLSGAGQRIFLEIWEAVLSCYQF